MVGNCSGTLDFKVGSVSVLLGGLRMRAVMENDSEGILDQIVCSVLKSVKVMSW